jgi:hypothetical protein
VLCVACVAALRETASADLTAEPRGRRRRAGPPLTVRP